MSEGNEDLTQRELKRKAINELLPMCEKPISMRELQEISPLKRYQLFSYMGELVSEGYVSKVWQGRTPVYRRILFTNYEGRTYERSTHDGMERPASVLLARWMGYP